MDVHLRTPQLRKWLMATLRRTTTVSSWITGAGKEIRVFGVVGCRHDTSTLFPLTEPLLVTITMRVHERVH